MKKLFSTIINEKYFFLILTLYFITGLVIFSDYGISWDEVNERHSGFVTLNEIYKILNLNILEGYPIYQIICTENTAFYLIYRWPL